MGRGRPRLSLDDRLARYVDVRGPDECWPWLGCRDHDGYGSMSFTDDTGNHKVKAHRAAFAKTHGHMPDLVRHRCDNPPCCNPAHLVDGTPADNSGDMVARGRSLAGAKNPGAKITEAVALKIRAAVGTHTEVARRFGISDVSVRNIRLRRTWKNV